LGIDKLSTDDRLQLVEDIWNSLEAEQLPPLTEIQLTELERRIANYEAHPKSASSWEFAKAELEAEKWVRISYSRLWSAKSTTNRFSTRSGVLNNHSSLA